MVTKIQGKLSVKYLALMAKFTFLAITLQFLVILNLNFETCVVPTSKLMRCYFQDNPLSMKQGHGY